MLTERVLNKTAAGLKKLGWNDVEIAKAVVTMNSNKDAVSIAMPAHFKTEAIQHAKCTCEYLLGLSPNSPKYNKEFKKAYRKYLTEAWLNSKGVEGDDDIKRGNPAGIEVNVFEQIEKDTGLKSPQIVKDKKAITKKAAPALMMMGRDRLLQSAIRSVYKDFVENREITDANAAQLVRDIMTQYSAAVTSLGNTFLYAFGNYKTKRNFSGTQIYNQEGGKLTGKIGRPGSGAAKALEFDKVDASPTADQKEELRSVTYRQMVRQAYIVAVSSIVGGIVRMDEKVIDQLYVGFENICKSLWVRETQINPSLGHGSQIPLSFLLQRNVREFVIKEFASVFAPSIFDLPKPYMADKIQKQSKKSGQQSALTLFDEDESIVSENFDKMREQFMQQISKNVSSFYEYSGKNYYPSNVSPDFPAFYVPKKKKF